MKLRILLFTALLTLPLAAMAQDAPVGATTTAAAKTVTSVKAKKPKAKKPAKQVAAKKEHWVCPMHDGYESDHPGKCKKCGMDLVKEEI
jgi:hypothetical protein